MKKLWIVLLLGFSFRNASADIILSSKEEPVAIKFVLNNVTASTSTVLIKLSDTLNYPHKYNGAININNIKVSVDKVAASSGTVKIGVITASSPTAVSVNFFYEGSFKRDTLATIFRENKNQDGFLTRCRVIASSTPYIATNDQIIASTIFGAGTLLPSPVGSSTVGGPGDIVMFYTANGAGTVDIDIELVYNSERQ